MTPPCNGEVINVLLEIVFERLHEAFLFEALHDGEIFSQRLLFSEDLHLILSPVVIVAIANRDCASTDGVTLVEVFLLCFDLHEHLISVWRDFNHFKFNDSWFPFFLLQIFPVVMVEEDINRIAMFDLFCYQSYHLLI